MRLLKNFQVAVALAVAMPVQADQPDLFASKAVINGVNNALLAQLQADRIIERYVSDPYMADYFGGLEESIECGSRKGRSVQVDESEKLKLAGILALIEKISEAKICVEETQVAYAFNKKDIIGQIGRDITNAEIAQHRGNTESPELSDNDMRTFLAQERYDNQVARIEKDLKDIEVAEKTVLPLFISRNSSIVRRTVSNSGVCGMYSSPAVR